jgi:hypothetical protein
VANPTLIYNLFGKAVNGYGASWGVPFDLAELRQHPLVAAGLLDLNNVRFVRLVAVVGNGQQSIDAYGHPIYDPWPTTGSPGPEVQAIGVLNTATAPDSANATASTSGMGAGGPGAPITAAGAKINRSAANAGRFIPTMFSASDPGSASTLVGDTGFSSADSTSPTLADETASHDTLMDISPNLVTGSSNESGVATGKIKSFSDSVPSAGSAIEQGQKNMAGSLAETVSPAVKIAAMRSLAATLPAKSPWASSSSLLSELGWVCLVEVVGSLMHLPARP